jgi:uncharacterized membrane protein
LKEQRSRTNLYSQWLLIFEIVFGIFIGLPFLAPVLMEIGLPGPGKAIYAIYSFLCHQLPQRSFFLFGPKLTYAIPEILADSPATSPTFWSLRQYLGSPELGWKVAWSDRMIAMYIPIWLLGLMWGKFGRRMRRLPWWGFILFLVPMGIDGISHMVSEITGFGFRLENLWLVRITGGSLPGWFYAGEALGSFNEIARLITGVLFGVGVVWFSFPYLTEEFQYYARRRALALASEEVK